jgi:hypothetical protein
LVPYWITSWRSSSRSSVRDGGDLMVAPLVIAAAVGVGYIASQIAISVGTGYAIDKTLGDGNYTRRELATDAVMGAIPGVGLLRPAGKILYSSRKLAYIDKTDRARDVALGMAYYNRANIAVIGKTIATEKAVSLLAGALIAESGRASSSSYQQSASRPGTSKRSGMVKPTWKSGGKGGKMRPSCPSGHKLRRIGKRLMCVKSS